MAQEAGAEAGAGSFITSARGRHLLYFQGYRHRIVRQDSGGQTSFWRCTKKTCRGRAKLAADGPELIAPHNHAAPAPREGGYDNSRFRVDLPEPYT